MDLTIIHTNGSYTAFFIWQHGSGPYEVAMLQLDESLKNELMENEHLVNLYDYEAQWQKVDLAESEFENYAAAEEIYHFALTRISGEILHESYL